MARIEAASFTLARPERRASRRTRIPGGMTRQAMNYLLSQLGTLGYIERRVDPKDVRTRCVYLTDRGASMIGVIRREVTEVEQDWEARLGTTDWQELKRLLVQLNDAVKSAPTAG